MVGNCGAGAGTHLVFMEEVLGMIGSVLAIVRAPAKYSKGLQVAIAHGVFVDHVQALEMCPYAIGHAQLRSQGPQKAARNTSLDPGLSERSTRPLGT